MTFRALRKGGADFLVLPKDASCAARAIDLYPAQTSTARVARRLLRIALACGIPLPLESETIRTDIASAFNEFLMRLAGTRKFPQIAILCGNPRTVGQRFIVLIFDGNGQPSRIVKAGLNEEARALIGREITFLKNVPAEKQAIPRLCDELEASGTKALALDFVEGDSPRDAQPRVSLLTSWLHKDSTIPLTSLPVWKLVAASCGSHPLLGRISAALAAQPARAAIYHGDFAPWNIKVTPDGTWTVLDWERGEITGPPGWDWFHYVIQTGILVGRLGTSQLADRVEETISSPEFTKYAAEARISGIKRELLLGYLLYCVEILKPTDSVEATRRLLEALQTR